MERVQIAPHEWFAVVSDKVRSGFLVAFEDVVACGQFVQKTVTELVDKAKKDRLRLHDALCKRESRLAKLLTDSSDAVVVTDDARRLVAANRAALALLGISENNMNKFTIDVFLLQAEAPRFQRTEQRGVCAIKRLNGQTRFVEFSFRANFVPGRHLSRFRDPKKFGSTLTGLTAPRAREVEGKLDRSKTSPYSSARPIPQPTRESELAFERLLIVASVNSRYGGGESYPTLQA